MGNYRDFKMDTTLFINDEEYHIKIKGAYFIDNKYVSSENDLSIDYDEIVAQTDNGAINLMCNQCSWLLNEKVLEQLNKDVYINYFGGGL